MEPIFPCDDFQVSHDLQICADLITFGIILIYFIPMPQTDLTVSLIQACLHWEDPAANLNMFSEKIDAIREKTELIILPEMFTTGFSMETEKLAQTMDGPAVSWMKQIAAQKKAILTGSLIIAEDGHYFNRLIWMLPNGQYGTYDKRHLFAYGKEDHHYTPGERRLIASVNGWKLCLNVCYDLRFPEWTRQMMAVGSEGQSNTPADPEYDILVYVANWPTRRALAWKTLLQARAIENQCYVIGVNRVGRDGHGEDHQGDSSLIDPMGEILYRKAQVEDSFTFSLSPTPLKEVRTRYPFLQDRDPFVLL
ncbi:MAG: nitrilase family protein [Chitinophagaceae bacterium]